MRYVPALDGLRGIAIALVVAYHAFGFPLGGWLGVDLFFVLSGFLITTLLLEEDRIRFRTFYARRARRLLPALGVVLAGYLAIAAIRGMDGIGAVARYGFYTGNVYEAFSPGAASRLVGLNHLWSLAQEEQFYLVWPAALLLVRRLQRPAPVLVATACALIVYRVLLADSGASDARVYFAPDTNVDGLLLGAALAFAPPRAVSTRVVKIAAAAAAFVAALLPSNAINDATALPVFELAAVVLVAGTVTGTLQLPRPLVWLGGISYSLYLWHAVVLWAFDREDPLLVVAISVALAQLSTTYVERPFRKRRHDARARRPPLTPAVETPG